jgi:hypothetical protein
MNSRRAWMHGRAANEVCDQPILSNAPSVEDCTTTEVEIGLSPAYRSRVLRGILINQCSTMLHINVIKCTLYLGALTLYTYNIISAYAIANFNKLYQMRITGVVTVH